MTISLSRRTLPQLFATPFRRLFRHLPSLFTRDNLSRYFGIAVALVSLLLGIVTYALLTDDPGEASESRKFYWILGLDIVLLLAMAYVVAGRVRDVWRQRLQHMAGARLHTQLMMIFSALVAVPAILVTVFAVMFIHFGVQSWFGEHISTAVRESQEVAQAYLKEHQQSIRADMLAMAGDLNRAAPRLLLDEEALNEFFQTQAFLRNLSEAILVDSTGRINARAGMSFSIGILPANFSDIIRQADSGQVVMLRSDSDDRVRALVKLDNFVDTYLFVGRFVDENVLARIFSTDRAADVYATLKERQNNFKITMTLVFVLVTLMLLLVAIWAGLTLAEKIIMPVTRLVRAAERVRAGDLSARVEVGQDDNEVTVLARAFNRMTDQLGAQRRDLLNANIQLDSRRRFIETVLGGVNAGIIGMDNKGVIQVTNASALRLLGRESDQVHGKRLAEICPEMETIRRALRSKPGRSMEAPIDVALAGQEQGSHWIVRMTAEGEAANDEAEPDGKENSAEQLRGYVATFDDLSPLINAQRKAAWSDVARRVAHEIKNPLTPIQLSAERLKRRYGRQISDDPETFAVCIDTIIRSVDDIRHMVDEFSNFARMPESSRKEENLVTLAQQVMVLFQQGHSGVTFRFNRPDEPVRAFIDRQQMTQALTNLVKNAYEAVHESASAGGQGEVVLDLRAQENGVTIQIADNGDGWPESVRDRLADPYVTTKNGGTGLGLAIVAKIIEDHGGTLEFLDNSPRGALVRVFIPKGDIHHG